jgi:predicted PurR-regulated permease PerM
MAPKLFRQNMSGDEIIQLAVRLALLVFLVFWSFVLVRPFIPILLWGIVLTVALYPVYAWLSLHLGDRPKLAATTITAIILAIIIGPVAWLGFGLVDGLQTLASQLGAGTFAIPSPPESVKGWPAVGTYVYGFWEQASTNLSALLRQFAPYLKQMAGPERSNSLRRSHSPASCSTTARGSLRQSGEFRRGWSRGEARISSRWPD